MKYLLILSLCFYCLNSQGKTVVVVAKNSSINHLTSQDIANIFLARTTRFPNGEKAIPLELKSSKIRDDFYQKISGKTARQLNAYWTTLIFTGKGKPAKGYPTPDDLLSKFNSNIGTIAYLSDTLVTDQMKIVYRFP